MKSRPATLIASSLLGLTCAFAGIAHSADVVEQLKACGRIADQVARLACYDDLGKQTIDAESSQKPTLADDIGGAGCEEKSGTPKRQDKGVVTSCEKGANRRWYFYFENGQVWKEVNTSGRRFKDCNFIASIARDGFGHKMQIDGTEKRIRVSRVR